MLLLLNSRFETKPMVSSPFTYITNNFIVEFTFLGTQGKKEHGTVSKESFKGNCYVREVERKALNGT